MKAEDIRNGEYYAVVTHPSRARYGIRKAQMVATTGVGIYKMRFPNPISIDGWYFIPDKTGGSKEHEMGADCLLSTWAEHKVREADKKRQKEKLVEGLEDIRKLIDNLRTAAEDKGFCLYDYSSEIYTEYDWDAEDSKKQTPAANLTISRELLLHLIETIERMDTPGGDVVAGLLEEKK